MCTARRSFSPLPGIDVFQTSMGRYNIWHFKIEFQSPYED